MHGRLKVRTTAQQDEAKKKERAKKLQIYRAAMKLIFDKRSRQEWDEELLMTSGEVLASNPDLYTVWNIRKEAFLAIKQQRSDAEFSELVSHELTFLESCLKVNPKSYSTWHHRGWLLDICACPDWSRELTLCNAYLDYDERNFHCWDYRRLVVKRSGVTAEAELDFTTAKIQANFSNFSSWHYRSKLLPIVHPGPHGVAESTLHQELELVQNAFFTDPNDQSAWFYHRWLLGIVQRQSHIRSLLVQRQTHSLVVLLSHSQKVGTTCTLSIQVNGQPLTSDLWFTDTEFGYSSLWFYPLRDLALDGDFKICVTLDDDEPCHVALLAGCQNGIWTTESVKPSSELTRATVDVLEKELDSCRQLDELEPGNKWTLLTILWLMRAIDAAKFATETLTLLDQLIKVDPARRRYYQDLKSSWITEQKLSDLSRDDSGDKSTVTLNLSSLSLTSLFQAERMLHITDLDLSHNALTSLKGSHFLQNLRRLRLEANQLRTTRELAQCPVLENLIIDDNGIDSIEGLASLSKCLLLTFLSVKKNRVCATSDICQKIKELLPHVITIQT